MKHKALAMIAAALPAVAMAQSAIDAYTLSQTDLQGTARFMSMGGAFGALGGDLSVLNQNPAGIGIYRKSDIGLTLNLDLQSSDVDGISSSRTTFSCPNFGYVGATSLNSDLMPFFQWGASYSRRASFDRKYKGGFGRLDTSMSNLIANFTDGYDPADLGQATDFNPYQQTDINWLSILAYNAYIINPVGGPSVTLDRYNGLYADGTTGNSLFDVRQKGYVDEYTVNFGGNLMDVVYWGLGIGITDISFREETYYDEELQQARIASDTGLTSPTVRGNAYYSLGNYRHISGNGFNVKLGVIYKPINELRLGFAFHTPTYYDLTTTYSSDIYYSYDSNVGSGMAYSDNAYYDWKMRTPWRMIFSAAGVIGGRFIVSGDYEMSATSSMTTSDRNGDQFEDFSYDISHYYKTVNTLRLGAEARVTPQLSVRAGFAYSSSAVKDGVNEGNEYVYTSGTNPAYTFDTSTRYITLGLGYRASNGFYADMAYVNRLRESTYHPFTSFDSDGVATNASIAGSSWVKAPAADFSTTDNQIVLTVGYKF